MNYLCEGVIHPVGYYGWDLGFRGYPTDDAHYQGLFRCRPLRSSRFRCRQCRSAVRRSLSLLSFVCSGLFSSSLWILHVWEIFRIQRLTPITCRGSSCACFRVCFPTVSRISIRVLLCVYKVPRSSTGMENKFRVIPRS